MTRLIVGPILLLSLACVIVAGAPEELMTEVAAEHNPGKRSEIAADFASKSLDQARVYYEAGDVAHGDQELDLVGKLAGECFDAAKESRKQRYWKRAELKISALRRRVHSLSDDLSYDRRDKAQELAVQLDAIHDKLLAGVMGK